jgi:hypothetical protein
MIPQRKMIGGMLACALFFSACSGLHAGAQSRVHARPKVNLQTAVARAVAALKEYLDIDDWAGRYELEIERHEDHWTLRFLYLPATAGGETCVLVYDAGKVEAIPGL